MTRPIVMAITGASGAIYAQRLLHVLMSAEHEVHLTVSPSGTAVIEQELGVSLSAERFDVGRFLATRAPWADREPPAVSHLTCACHHYADFLSPIASGSFRTRGMVICPCSGSTLSGIARAAGQNLVQRAAECHLKERRPLILVPRESPLSILQIENMQRAATAGATVLPAMPGWYHGVTSLDDLVNFVVSRILDHLDIDNDLMRRWGEES